MSVTIMMINLCFLYKLLITELEIILSKTGKPFTEITWFRGSTIIDDTYFMSDDGSSLNILHLPALKRDDLMMIVTCKATNNNITEPITRSIAIDLNSDGKQ
uniref:Ig-like domain-containing protein n=1 Tax=Tetranychus urticae TaxID=32264 RepID=T1L6C2_TETUR